MFVEPFFRSLPLAIPTMIGSGVLAIVGAAWWARWLRVPRATAVIFVTICGTYLGVTATPTDTGLWANPGDGPRVSFSVQFPPLESFFMVTSASLNLFAGAALGAASALVWRAGRRSVAAGTAIGLPFLVEVVQMFLPELGRVAFVLGDVLVNWIGAAIGAGFVAAVALSTRWARPTGVVPE